MHRFQNFNGFRFSSAVLACVLMAGCGEAPAGRGVPVEGTVTMDGKPLDGATITFMNDTFAGFGRTDANGKYRLVQGALPGVNKVVVSKLPPGAVDPTVVLDPENGIDAGQIEAQAMGSGKKVQDLRPKDLVPADYSDPAKTKLTYDVPAGGSTGVDFNI